MLGTAFCRYSVAVGFCYCTATICWDSTHEAFHLGRGHQGGRHPGLIASPSRTQKPWLHTNFGYLLCFLLWPACQGQSIERHSQRVSSEGALTPVWWDPILGPNLDPLVFILIFTCTTSCRNSGLIKHRVDITVTCLSDSGPAIRTCPNPPPSWNPH